MKLVYSVNKLEVKVNDKVELHNSKDVFYVISIEKPRHGGSTGRVHVSKKKEDTSFNVQSFYPSVIGAEWIEREDQ